jgi:hypothetical protein
MKLIAPRSAGSMDGDSDCASRGSGDPSTGSVSTRRGVRRIAASNDALAQSGPSDEIAPTGLVAGLPAHSVVRLDLRAALCRTTVSSARSRCVPLPRVASGRLGRSRVDCDLNQPFRFGVLLTAVRRTNGVKVLHMTESRRGGGDGMSATNELT